MNRSVEPAIEAPIGEGAMLVLVRTQSLILVLLGVGCVQKWPDRPSPSPTPIEVQPELDPGGCRLRATSVTAGHSHACALMTDGTVL